MEKDCYSNLNKEFKFLGIIDYKSAIILLIYIVILWNVLSLFDLSVIYRLYIELILSIPILGLFYSNKSSESISDILYVIIKFVFSPRIYAYKIESNINVLK